MPKKSCYSLAMIDHNSYIADVPEMDGLTELQKKFVVCYTLDPKHNGTQAVIDAGYEVKSRNAAGVQAHENLRNPKVYKAFRALQQKFGGPTDKETAIYRLWAIIETDITQVMSWDADGTSKMVPSKKLGPQAALAIASIQDSREDDGQMALPGLEDDVAPLKSAKVKRSVKLHDPLKAIDLLARISGWYAPAKIDVSGGLTLEALEAAREQVRSGQS